MRKGDGVLIWTVFLENYAFSYCQFKFLQQNCEILRSNPNIYVAGKLRIFWNCHVRNKCSYCLIKEIQLGGLTWWTVWWTDPKQRISVPLALILAFKTACTAKYAHCSSTLNKGAIKVTLQNKCKHMRIITLQRIALPALYALFCEFTLVSWIWVVPSWNFCLLDRSACRYHVKKLKNTQTSHTQTQAGTVHTNTHRHVARAQGGARPPLPHYGQRSWP